MPAFGNRSRANLETCDDRIQEVFNEVIKHIDCSVLEGRRGKDRQNFLYDTGQSKVRFPDGKHNSSPSKAVDVAPYPIDWDNKERFILFAGFVLGIAQSKGITLRWGGDWNKDFDTKDTAFFDAPHFETIDRDWETG